MNSKILKLLALAVVVGLFVGSMMPAAGAPNDPNNKDGKKEKQSLYKAAGSPTYAILNINNLTAWARYDGLGAFSPSSDNGVYYPRGTGNVVYKDGFVYGGKVFTGGFEGTGTPAYNGHTVRVGGGTYGIGTRAGYVTGTGANAVAAPQSNPEVRIYRIRRDYRNLKDQTTGVYSADLKRDAGDVNEIPSTEVTDAQAEAVYQQYETDWQNWPVQYGAPYIERNGVAGYQAPPNFSSTFTVDSLISGNYDEPGVAGADPNSPADQVVWTVYNDLNESTALSFVSSESIGMEVQKTMWAYKRSDALGNLFFYRYRLINVGGVKIDNAGTLGSYYVDSMYVCQWSDIDLGSFSDDLAGCDSTLSMGFCYNGNAVDATFRNYGLAPPAPGYDFLAGPTINFVGDSAVFDLKRLYDHRNLGMSSFAYFSAGSPYSDPPNGVAGGYDGTTGQWWKMLRGFAPVGTMQDPDQPYASGAFPVSKFPLSGDPAAGTGFLDGKGTSSSFVPGDRRILLNSGPFQMAPGDTQEVTVGFVVGLGSDRLSSVTVMKFNDRTVQNTYDALFQVPKPPPPPAVKYAEMDGQVIFEWASNDAQRKLIENGVSQPGNYVFEGYNFYQLPSRTSPKSEWKRVKTWDLTTDPAVILDEQVDNASGQVLSLPVEFGSNSGIKRDFIFDRDYIRDINKIYNGQEYYVVVTAYSRATVPGYLPAALESDPIVYTVRPKIPYGQAFTTAYGDTVTVTHTAGSSDGSVLPMVVNPEAGTGHTYEVHFDTTGGVDSWYVNDVNTSTKVAAGTNLSGDDNYAITDGVRIKVLGPPLQGKSYSYTSETPANLSPVAVAEQGYTGGRWITGGNHGGELFFGGIFMEPNFNGTDLGPADYRTVQVHFSPMQSYTDLTGDGEFTIGEPYTWDTNVNSQKAFLYGGFADNTYAGFQQEPFSAYDVTDPANPVQLNMILRDRDGDGLWELHADNTTVTNAALLPNAGDLRYNYLWVTNTPYDASGTLYGDGTGGTIGFMSTSHGAMWVLWCNDRGSGGMLAEASHFTLTPNLVNTVADVFTFTIPAAVANTAQEKVSIEKVGVFPNPYYAFNAAETNRFVRFVTFNNLPPKATIRIFNLAGQLVRRLDKDDPTQFFRWDLLNAANFPVASGMYIAHLDMTLKDGSTMTKILKFAIIQEQEILNSY